MTRRWRRPVGQTGRRGDFDEFLVATLDAAIALPQVTDGPGAVADDLHLDVPGARQQLFHVHVTAAERRPRFGLAARVGVLQFLAAPHHAHAAPTAAADGLDQHGAGGGQGVEEIGGFGKAGRAGSAGQDGHAKPFGQGAGFGFVAEQRQQLGARPDKGEIGIGTAAGKLGVLAQKAVSGMDGVAASLLGRLQDSVDVQIGSGSGLGQGVRHVRQAPVQRFGVVLRKHRHRAHAQFRGGAQDADGNLAAVGNQQFGGH